VNGLIWSAIVSAVLAAWILFGLGGREYYFTPLAVRGYAAAHHLLRPSGPAGQMFGIAGAALMLMPFLYMARKRAAGLKRVGTLKTWLEVHLFCGVVGPVLVTFHTSFKFNGIVSAAYWSMVVVVLSGFVGRYLYVRIPRSIRGVELTRAELDAKADEITADLAASVDQASVAAQVDAFERASRPGRLSFLDLVVGDVRLARRCRALSHELARAGLEKGRQEAIVQLSTDRARLLRRIAYLQQTKTLFSLWHVLHLPLVYLMVVIVTAHVAITVYMGYVPFRW